VRIGASHVRDAPDLTLSPKQLIVIEFRHTIEVNRIDRDDPAFSQCAKCGKHYIARRSERNRAVELVRRSVRAAQPRNPHSDADRERRTVARDNLTHDLMSRHERASMNGKLAFGNMKVGSTNPARANTEKHFTEGGLRDRNLFEAQRLAG
jgi:hypothetical protein